MLHTFAKLIFDDIEGEKDREMGRDSAESLSIICTFRLDAVAV